MDFRILGSLEVYDNERPLSLGGHQQRALLALLLLRANQVVPVDEIVEDLWGARPPPSATKSVQTLVSKLRKLLAEPGADAEDLSEDGILLTRSHGYVLTVAPGELDLHRFQSLTEEGRRALAAGRADEAAERLRGERAPDEVATREPLVQTLDSPERLSGAVTFLFTDIEGSTRLVKQLRERWGPVVADHQRILREAFAAHRGQEIDTHGDAFFVAFGTARDAVLAASEGQRALAEHIWPEGAELQVRMGIHSGQAAHSEDRYLGLAVHRAARICAVANGGQILLSQTTVNLLEDEEEELSGIELRDLGEQRLKDLHRPVRLSQLVVEGLPSDFPPLEGTGDGGPYH